MTPREKLATIRLLWVVASADRVLTPDEREALSAAIAEIHKADPELVDLDLASLARDPIDEQAEIAALTSSEARLRAYEAAVALANVDEACSPAEQEVLDRLQQRLGIDLEQRDLLARVISEARDTVLPSSVPSIADPARRQAEIAEDTLKYAILAAALGAFPIPGLAIATDLGVTLIQTKLARDVAQYHGKALDSKQAAELFGAAGLGLGVRVALSNLAKLIPGYGSAAGAAAAFASTYAVGTVVDRYFELGGLSAGSLRSEFSAAEAGGREKFRAEQAKVAARQEQLRPALDALRQDLEQGKISRAEYESRLSNLR